MSAAVVSVEVQRIVMPRDHAESASGQRAGVSADPVEVFEEVIRQTLDGPVLRYSQRLELLRTAEKLGIGRFEANLIIAKVLHQEGRGQEMEMRPEGGSWVFAVVVVMVLQGMIIGGAWWILR